VNGDGFLFGNTIKRMIIKASYMGQDMNFNSDKKEDMEGQMGQMLKDKIGKTEDVSVDKRGKVIEMKGDTAKAAGSMGDMMNMASQLAKGQAYPLLAQLPTAKIKAGDSWTDSTGSPETIKTVTTYTLKEIKGDSMLVSYTGTIAKSGTIQQNGMEIQIEMGGTVKGNAAYETASGLLKSNNAVSDIKGSFQVMGQSVPMTVSITANTIARKL
jgi:major membrane immunogen (membrane-anchored lipoprotein)